ncbi:hypothetical protein V8F33_010057 [Rhypophila sp. PSN 637]
MDPISAFGLFCNVLTVVDAAANATRGLRVLYNSTSGLSKFNERIQDQTNRLGEIAKELSSSKDQLELVSPQRPLVGKVALECRLAAEQVDVILNKCRVDAQSPKTLAVLKAWVVSSRKKSEIEHLQAQFEARADELRTAMAAATLADLMNLKETLSSMAVGQADIMDQLSSVTDQLSAQTTTFSDMARSLSLAREAQALIKHGLIIRALEPPTTYSRESEVADRYGRTFEWITSPETDATRLGTHTSFVDWLKGGSGVFHFAGKPGAGKSTLMKFLANDARVKGFLEEWANARDKKIVVSKFFFWRHGSTEQKSVSGLLRGLLHELCYASPRLTELLFPDMLAEDAIGLRRGSGPPELRITGAQVRAAFDRVRVDPDIGKEFGLCFFIDGLDEFDGREMAHWRLATMVREWSSTAENGVDVKLCVSSREDHAIVAAFGNSHHQVRLQKITRSDICSVVTETLDNNEFFDELKHQDRAASGQGLINKILQGADGVFLWVAMLLNLLEDELPGASSMGQLYRIVETTPSRIEDFINDILGRIKKHHQRGAYLLLAMALRMTGFHLGDQTSWFPSQDNAIYHSVVEFEKFWRPHLPVYGLRVALEALLPAQPESSIARYRRVLAEYQTTDYLRTTDEATTLIRDWSKGLLDVVGGDINQISGSLGEVFWNNNYTPLHNRGELASPGFYGRTSYRATVAKFMHRSIPDHLMCVMREKAVQYGFNDQDITEGIIIALIAETQAPYNDLDPSQGSNMAYYLQHLLRLLRLRPIEPTSNILPLLDDLEVARFDAFLRVNGKLCSPLPPPGSQQTLMIGWTDTNPHPEPTMHIGDRTRKFSSHLIWDHTASVLAHASHSGLFEYIQWKFRDNELAAVERQRLLFTAFTGVTSFYSWFWREFPSAYTKTLQAVISAGASLTGNPSDLNNLWIGREPALLPDETMADGFADIHIHPLLHSLDLRKEISQRVPGRISSQWPWLDVIPSILDALVRLSCPPSGVWDFLETWLIGLDAPPPDKICCAYQTKTSQEQRLWGLREPSNRALGCRDYYHRYPVVIYGVTLDIDDDSSGEKIFKGGFELNSGNSHELVHQRDAVDSSSSQGGHEHDGVFTNLARCFGDPLESQIRGSRPKSVSLAELVRYHAPPNMGVLLGHLERRSGARVIELNDRPP